VTIDVGWTPQLKVLPNVRSLIAPRGRVVTLVKPHYEADRSLLESGVLPEQYFDETVERVLNGIREDGWAVEMTAQSPIAGHGGNAELFALLHDSPGHA